MKEQEPPTFNGHDQHAKIRVMHKIRCVGGCDKTKSVRAFPRPHGVYSDTCHQCVDKLAYMPAPVSTEIARATLPLVVLPPLLPKRPALSMRAGYGFDAFTDDTSGEWTIVQENARIFFTDFEAAALSKILANRTSAA